MRTPFVSQLQPAPRRPRSVNRFAVRPVPRSQQLQMRISASPKCTHFLIVPHLCISTRCCRASVPNSSLRAAISRRTSSAAAGAHDHRIYSLSSRCQAAHHYTSVLPSRATSLCSLIATTARLSCPPYSFIPQSTRRKVPARTSELKPLPHLFL